MNNAITVYSPQTHSYHHHRPHEAAAITSEQQPSPSLGPWSTGLFDCFDDFNSCCLTLWCPCITVGRVSEIIHQGVISCRLSGTLWTLLICACWCSCCYSAWVRSKMRKRYSLETQPCNDFCLHFFCEEFALCQEYRELVNRGYDMSIGWNGNVERHQRMVAMVTTQPTGQWSMVR